MILYRHLFLFHSFSHKAPLGMFKLKAKEKIKFPRTMCPCSQDLLRPSFNLFEIIMQSPMCFCPREYLGHMLHDSPEATGQAK